MPAALPLSASLLSCPKALSRCRQILLAHSSSNEAAGHRPASQALAGTGETAADGTSSSSAPLPVPPGYIVPGCSSEHDVDVAVKLGVPLLGPSPQLAQVLASRIGSR
jgi:hypothetical protein